MISRRPWIPSRQCETLVHMPKKNLHELNLKRESYVSCTVQLNDSTSPDGPSLGLGSVQSSPNGRLNWTGPQTASLGLDRLGLDQSTQAYNFDIVS